MILIVDSGSTKTEWRLLLDDGRVQAITSLGINPYFIDAESIQQQLLKELPENWIHEGKISKIYYYGTGCGNTLQQRNIEENLRRLFPEAHLNVASDLLGACRALWQHRSGYTGILGTGCNACYYDGNEITWSMKSLGFILGDEGSGADIGKRLLKKYLEDQLDEFLAEKFRQQFPFQLSEFLETIYSKPFPNRFLASLVSFVKANLQDNQLKSIVYTSFDDFFKLLKPITDSNRENEIRFTGSVAWAFEEILRQVASAYHYQVSVVIQNPIDLLVQFHRIDA